MTTAARDLRRRGMLTLGALEFRVGLYAWITRIVWTQRYGELWAILAVGAIALVPLFSFMFEHDVVQTVNGLEVVLTYAARVLVLAAITGSFVVAPTGAPAERGASRGKPAPRPAHPTRLLPLSPGQRSTAGLLGRFVGMAVPLAPALALLVAAGLIVRSAGGHATYFREAAVWALAAPALLALWGMSPSLSTRSEHVGSAIGAFYPYYLVSRVGIGPHQRYPVWLPAAVIAALALVPLAFRLVVGLIERGVDVGERLTHRASATTPGEATGRPGLRWGINWNWVCTPEAGARRWLGALAAVVTHMLVGILACLAVCASCGMPLAPVIALLCFLILPTVGAVLAVAVSTSGAVEASPQALRELLPLPANARWRTQLLAALTCTLTFAAIGEACGFGGLALLRAIGGSAHTSLTWMGWLPLIIPGAALAISAQEPIVRYPFRLFASEGILWAVILGIAILILLPLSFALAEGGQGWAVPCGALLWLVALVLVPFSRDTSDPRRWELDADGSLAYSASQRAFGAVLISAGALALTASAILAAIMAILSS